MHGLYVEHRTIGDSEALSWDLARHMYARSQCGKVAVVTDKPKELLSATRKQWIKVMRQVQMERSSTLNASRILEFTHQISRMQTMRFSAKAPDDVLAADVTFATPDVFTAAPPTCLTLYITCAVEKEKLYMITAWVPKGGVVVLYE